MIFSARPVRGLQRTRKPLVIQNLVATGKARYVFHNYPFLDGNGVGSSGESDQAANAAMCANEQDKFWEMHSTLYANWNENQGAFSSRRLQAMAESLAGYGCLQQLFQCQ